MDLEFVHKLSDHELLARVQELARDEHRATATLVAHLSEIERRQLYLDQGCRSLFAYCTHVLHLSEHAAYNRIEVARVALRFPAVLTQLAEGHLHLTAIRLLAPCLTAENQIEMLTAAKHKSRREVEEMLARLRPRPDAAASVRKLPGSGVQQSPGNPVPNPEAQRPSLFEQPQPAPQSTGGAPKSATIVPLAPERYKVQFTVNAATCAKLRRAQELLRHRIPSGDVAAVVDEALDLLVRELEKRKFAAIARPRRSGSEVPAGLDGSGSEAPAGLERSGSEAPAGLGAPPAPGGTKHSRHIPAAVKRAVWQRDGGQCAFVGVNGLRCTERGQLEFDHIRPYADGGAPTTANVRLLCRHHNQHESRSFFGTWQADSTDYSSQNESIRELAPGQVRTG